MDAFITQRSMQFNIIYIMRSHGLEEGVSGLRSASIEESLIHL